MINVQDDKLNTPGAAHPKGPWQYKFLITTSLPGGDSDEFIMTNIEAVGLIPQSWILNTVSLPVMCSKTEVSSPMFIGCPILLLSIFKVDQVNLLTGEILGV